MRPPRLPISRTALLLASMLPLERLRTARVRRCRLAGRPVSHPGRMRCPPTGSTAGDEMEHPLPAQPRAERRQAGDRSGRPGHRTAARARRCRRAGQTVAEFRAQARAGLRQQAARGRSGRRATRLQLVAHLRRRRGENAGRAPVASGGRTCCKACCKRADSLDTARTDEVVVIRRRADNTPMLRTVNLQPLCRVTVNPADDYPAAGGRRDLRAEIRHCAASTCSWTNT